MLSPVKSFTITFNSYFLTYLVNVWMALLPPLLCFKSRVSDFRKIIVLFWLFWYFIFKMGWISPFKRPIKKLIQVGNHKGWKHSHTNVLRALVNNIPKIPNFSLIWPELLGWPRSAQPLQINLHCLYWKYKLMTNCNYLMTKPAKWLNLFMFYFIYTFMV